MRELPSGGKTNRASTTNSMKAKGFLKGFFQWFDFSNFMDTYQEWHAFVEGFSEGFCIFKDSVYTPDTERLADLQAEHHYYAAGYALGFASLIVLLTGMVVWIIGAIHGT